MSFNRIVHGKMMLLTSEIISEQAEMLALIYDELAADNKCDALKSSILEKAKRIKQLYEDHEKSFTGDTDPYL